jgi:hypothetical protein
LGVPACNNYNVEISQYAMGHARGDLDCSHELNCELGESCFDSVTHEGAHAFAADRCPDNEVDYVETFAVSDLECSGVGVALVNHQFRI